VSEIFEPFESLIEISVLGHRLAVPERNTLLRQLQYACPEVASGPFCWNAECRKCEVEYSLADGGHRRAGLACRMRGVAGLRLLRLTPELRFALGTLLKARGGRSGP
jgi:hypothetical protein